MTPQPGALRVRDAQQATLALQPKADSKGRRVAVTIDGSGVELSGAHAVEQLAAYLTRVGAWMREGEANAKALDDFENVMDRFRDIAQRGAK